MRTFSDDVTALVEKQMRRIVEMTCAAHGAEAKFDFHWNYPPTVNDAREAEFAATVMDDIVGTDNVVRNIEPTMGAEDFAFMLKAKAGAYVFIGNGDGDAPRLRPRARTVPEAARRYLSGALRS